jgi:hypothetical protein
MNYPGWGKLYKQEKDYFLPDFPDQKIQDREVNNQQFKRKRTIVFSEGK